MELSASFKENKTQFNLKSCKFNRFEIPSKDFMAGLSHSEYWFPEDLTVWFYLSAYREMPSEIQKRYNQLYALATNEVFAILENELITPILVKLSHEKGIDPEYAQALKNFCDEEKKHADMFMQLCRVAEPKLYSGSGYFFSQNASPLGLSLIELIKRFPYFFGVWLWIVIYFEERSLLYARHFLRKKNDHVSSIFREIHRLHMLEETHHVQIDELLVESHYSKLNLFQKKLTSMMFENVLQSFAAPRRMSFAIAEILKKEFPASKVEINKCLSELPRLKTHSQFQTTFLGPQSAPRTWKLLRKQAEMAPILKRFNLDSSANLKN